MNIIERATIIHFHRHRIAEYSPGTVKALGWKGPESQCKRFEVLATVGNLHSCTVLDLGCGYGDFRAFLETRYSHFTYIGIDQVPEFIEYACGRYEDLPRTYFFQADFSTAQLPPVDYVVASGALGYRCDDPEYYCEMIGKMYSAAAKAVAFNMLDAACFPEHPLLMAHDREKVRESCLKLTPDVTMVQGYLEDDFTVFMGKDRHRKSR